MLRPYTHSSVFLQDLVTARRRVDECEPAKRHRWTKEYERQVATLVQWLVNNKVGCVDVTLSLSGLKTYWNSWTSEFEPQSLALYQMKVRFAYQRVHLFCPEGTVLRLGSGSTERSILYSLGPVRAVLALVCFVPGHAQA